MTVSDNCLNLSIFKDKVWWWFMVKYWFEFLFHIIYYMTIILLKGINKEGNLFIRWYGYSVRIKKLKRSNITSSGWKSELELELFRVFLDSNRFSKGEKSTYFWMLNKTTNYNPFSHNIHYTTTCLLSFTVCHPAF